MAIEPEVRTRMEKLIVPIAGGSLFGVGAFKLAKENPEIFAAATGVITATLLAK